MKPEFLQNLEVNAVATSFARAATNYDTVARLQREVGSILFDKLTSHCLANQSILDVGAGTGYCTELLIGQDTNVVALDIAPAMLTQARQRLGGKASYLAADAQSLPLKDHSVDIVFANLVLQWCVDLSAVFQEFKRVLKNDGQIVFSSLGPQTLWELRSAWQNVDAYRHVNDFVDIKHVQQQIEYAGLNGIVETRMITLEYTSAIHLMRELKTLGAANTSHHRHRGLTGKSRLQQVSDEYSKLMGNQVTQATWHVLIGQLRLAE
ncbi:MAG: malonyl-ACP O-methyltransferase BioC [Methylococcales bacterium]